MSEEELRVHQLTSCDYDQRLQAAGQIGKHVEERRQVVRQRAERRTDR